MAKNKRVSQGQIIVSDQKRVGHGGDPDSYKKQHPAWSFRRLDKYCWAFSDKDPFDNDILKKLSDYEGLTWAEIESASGGKSPGHGSNSHFIPVSEIATEAQKRLCELHMDDVDELFSLRLTGQKRLWGTLEKNMMQVLWYDPHHEIARTKR